MGKLKQEMLNDYLYNTEQGLPVWRPPISAKRGVALRNAKQHLADREPKCCELWELADQMQRNSEQHWAEEMPDLMGEALAQAERDFLESSWFQLELDLWEGRNGVNEWTAWDVEGGTVRG